MFLGLDMVLYIVGQLHYIYVTLSRLIVLYSRCRVNRCTNMFVVMYYVIYFCFASTAFWAPFVCALPNLWGAPHHDVHSVTMVSELWTQLPSSPPRTSPCLSPSLGASRVGCRLSPTCGHAARCAAVRRTVKQRL